MRECLAGAAGLEDELVDLVVLLASELAANAIVHARLTFQLDLELGDSSIRVSVTDLSAMLPVSRDPGEDDTSGRGLAMVAAASDRWGVERIGVGKRTWFEVSR